MTIFSRIPSPYLKGVLIRRIPGMIFFVVKFEKNLNRILTLFLVIYGDSRQGSCQDSRRDFSRQRLSPRVLPRVSDRILCTTLGETLSETRFFTRDPSNERLGWKRRRVNKAGFRANHQ